MTDYGFRPGDRQHPVHGGCPACGNTLAFDADGNLAQTDCRCRRTDDEQGEMEQAALDYLRSPDWTIDMQTERAEWWGGR